MGKNILITAGGTSEPIDTVRKITNFATGSLGSEICFEILTNYDANIDRIFYLCPKNAVLPSSHSKLNLIFTETSENVLSEITHILTTEKIDVCIHSMAVSDYVVDYVSDVSEIAEKLHNEFCLAPEISIEKIKGVLQTAITPITDSKISSNRDDLVIKLKKGPKIINNIKSLSPNTMLVGFKLLSNVSKDELYNVAHNLLEKNHAGYVVANDLSDIKDGKHKAMIIDNSGVVANCDTKKDIAKKLCKLIL